VIKRLVFIIIGVLAISTNLYAVPAAPHFHDLQQPDGSTIAARQWGDEHSHGWSTDAGHTIVFDKMIKGWVYAVHDKDGKLSSSSILVNKAVSPPAGIQKNLRNRKSSLRRVLGQSASSAPSLVAPLFAAPISSTKSLPVILIGFKDAPFTKTKADFDNLLFGSSGNTMKNYYLENSYGQLIVNGGTSGVFGPVESEKARTYYGAPTATDDDAFAGTLVYEAVSQAAGNGFSFAPFVDQSKSCYVEVVVIAHQGTGQESGFDASDIWSHSWDLNSAKHYGNSSNGEFVTAEPCSRGGFIKVNNYTIQPELAVPNGTMIGAGVFAHEFGHALGLPDLYDTDDSSSGAGNWSLMAGGSWLGETSSYNLRSYNTGDSPSHLDPWSKYYLGWITPTIVTGVNPNQSVAAASSPSPNFYTLGTGTPTSGEYFLVENRQKTGFDSYLNGAGLLVWHIDGGTISNLIANNEINNNECISLVPGACAGSTAHYGVALIQADNLLSLENNVNSGSTGDPYFSPKILTDFTSPTSRLWSGAASGWSVTSISTSATTMTASISYIPPVTIPLPTAIDNNDWMVTTGGNGIWSGQSATTHDGIDAAQSLPIDDLQSTWMQAMVTGPGTLSFWWKVSSEPNYDYLRFYIDGVLQAGISGAVDWTQVKGIPVSTGNVLKWEYSKDTYVAVGSDAGWVDQVVLSYPLTYTFAGTGYGSVNSTVPASPTLNCTTGSTCNPVSFPATTSVTLMALPDSSSAYNSTFTNWTTNTSACPSQGSCSVTMNGPVNVTGTFTRDKLVNFRPEVIGTHGTILEAYTAAAASGQTIQVRDNSLLTPFGDALTINKSVTLIGGFDSSFVYSPTGYTTMNGKLTIGSGGVLKVQRIIVR
jgi:M6 family metalloprotease-like protein